MNLNWIELIVAFVAGGGTQAVLNYITSIKESKRDDFEKIVETWEQDNERLRKENDVLRAEIKNLQEQLNTLKARVAHLEETQP